MFKKSMTIAGFDDALFQAMEEERLRSGKSHRIDRIWRITPVRV